MKKIVIIILLTCSIVLANDYINITLTSFADLVSKKTSKNIYIDEDINASSVSLFVPCTIGNKDIFNLFKVSIRKSGFNLKKLGSVYYLSKKYHLKEITKLISLKYDSSNDIEPLLSSMQIKYKYLINSNSLLITSKPDLMKKIQNYINILDTKAKQVKVKIMVFEYDSDNIRDVGLQLGSLYKDITKSTQVALNAIISTVSTHGIALTSSSFYGALKLLETHNIINVKQYPYILAKNNHKFTFEAVRNVPYKVVTTNTDSSTVQQQTSIEYKDVGLQINGKLLTHKDYATLNLSLIIQDFVNDTITDTPQTYKRSLSSSTDINYNKVLLISGLKRIRHNVNDYSVPYLSNIPYLGKIFQYKTKKQEEINITIAIELINDRSLPTFTMSEVRTSVKEAKPLGYL